MADNHSNQLEALKIVQNIITRLANTSFILKGWTVTVVVVSMLLSKNGVIVKWIAFIPIVSFWILDAYYLHQERLFRALSRWIAGDSAKSFEEMFCFDLRPFKKEHKYWRALLSLTEALFYLTVAALALAIILLETEAGTGLPSAVSNP